MHVRSPDGRCHLLAIFCLHHRPQRTRKSHTQLLGLGTRDGLRAATTLLLSDAVLAASITTPLLVLCISTVTLQLEFVSHPSTDNTGHL